MSIANVNKIILLADLGHDPELRYTAKGNAVLSLSLATHRNFKNADGELKKETHWHKATVWGKRAESCAKYLVKGSKVYVEGELQAKTYTDKEGITRKSAEILVNTVTFMGGTRREPTVSSPEPLEVSALTH